MLNWHRQRRVAEADIVDRDIGLQYIQVPSRERPAGDVGGHLNSSRGLLDMAGEHLGLRRLKDLVQQIDQAVRRRFSRHTRIDGGSVSRCVTNTSP